MCVLGSRTLNEYDDDDVYMVDNNVIPSINPRVPDHVSLNYIAFTRTNVFKGLNKLNAKSAGGPDHLPPILLKNIASSIASHQFLSYFSKFLPTQNLEIFIWQANFQEYRLIICVKLLAHFINVHLLQGNGKRDS